MAFLDLNIFSTALSMQTSVLVVIPQNDTAGQIGVENKNVTGKFKTLYLLHGLSDDHTIWMRRTSIERYATNYGICVVMPNGGRSFYTDMKYGGKYQTFITKELSSVIESMLNVSPKREDRYIGGLSMGGYGAFKIALSNPDKYNKAFALSPVANIFDPWFKETLIPVFGEIIPKEADLKNLLEAENAQSIKPKLFMATGLADTMYNDQKALAEYIKSLDYDFTYIERQGGHTWLLWDQLVKDALEWAFNQENSKA